jgi:hypothetical protein
MKNAELQANYKNHMKVVTSVAFVNLELLTSY